MDTPPLIGVVAHTARQTQARNLARTVSAAVLSIDDGALGCDANHSRVWRALLDLARSDQQWLVVLEDDAQPIPDFTRQLAHAFHWAPTPIVSFYLGTSRPPQHQPAIRRAIHNAARVGAAWITSPHLYHAVAAAIKAVDVAHMLPRLSADPIDEAITHWAMRTRRCVSYTWPSIVDHTDQPTLVKHRDRQPRTKPRHAWSCGTPQWNATTVHIGW